MRKKTLVKAIIGSQAYGTNIETSDTDYKGIYVQSKEDILTTKYKEQFEVGKDETYFEIRRFLELASSANPTMLELLFVDREYIVESSPEYELLREHRLKFLTKKCRNSFGGYAVAQIQKAKGLNKKMNFEKQRVERKTVLDFCYVYEKGITLPVKEWLFQHSMNQEHCGLTKLEHFRGCYALYYDWVIHFSHENSQGFKGIVLDDSNDVRVTSVPKNQNPETILYFNKDGYSVHCKDFNEYQTWLKNRNTARYVDIDSHGQQIDGKNLLHCRRLLDMAIEIANTGNLNVRRPNAAELIAIRKGQIVSLEEVIQKAEQDVKLIDEYYSMSELPDSVEPEFLDELLLKIREMSYSSEEGFN